MKKLAARQASVAKGILRVPDGEAQSARAGDEPEPVKFLLLRLVGLTTAVFVPCGLLAMILCRRPEPARLWWLSESGPVELGSGCGYGLLAIALLTVAALRLRKRIGKSRLQSARSTRSETSEAVWHPMLLGSCAAVLAAREFDWHNIWTTEGVLKTRFYVDPTISIAEKLAAVAVLSLIGFLVGTTIRAYGRKFLAQLRRGQTAAWLAATGIALLPASKVLDSGPRIFKRLLPDDPTNVHRFLGSVEEIMELTIPALFLMAVIVTIWPRHPSGTVSRDAGAESQLRRAA